MLKYLKSKPFIIRFMLILLIIEIIFFINYKVIFGSGSSMSPLIEDGSILICDYTKNYKLNDIIYFTVGNKHIVHRITKITEYKLTDNSIIKGYQTKGDNNKEVDMFEIYDENIICKVVFYTQRRF